MDELRTSSRYPQDWLRTINLLIRGRGNCAGELTLTPDATQTVVPLLGEIGNDNSQVVLTAKTASAAAAATSVYATVNAQQITVTHDSNSATDRTFGWIIRGG